MGNDKFFIVVEQSRYDELIAKEERLRLLDTALREMSVYTDVYSLRRIFGVEEKERTLTNE